MARYLLTVSESRRLADMVAEEIMRRGLGGKERMTQEARRRIRKNVLKIILAEREKTGTGDGTNLLSGIID